MVATVVGMTPHYASGIVLGGTFEHHVSSLEPDIAAQDRIMAAHAQFFASVQS